MAKPDEQRQIFDCNYLIGKCVRINTPWRHIKYLRNFSLLTIDKFRPGSDGDSLYGAIRTQTCFRSKQPALTNKPKL
jgi:hypothetical protein